MFELKYTIELQNAEKVFLFGEDYYHDKSNFWKYHQTELANLYKLVMKTGFPIKITDMEDENLLMIHSKKEFHDWLKTNQPFKIED